MTKQVVISSGDEAEAFLYHLTHDLRAYVRALRTIPDWIDEDLAAARVSLPPDVVAHLTLLRDYAGGIDGMLSALTDLSRVGRLADAPGPIDLWPCLQTLWHRIPGAAAFRLDLAGPGARIFGRRNDIERLLSAVLANTVDHHQRDAGHVHVTCQRDAARVRLRVEDDGPGIAAEFRGQVFKPLHTLRPRSETGRAGVGLAIARKVVVQHGGHIRLCDPDKLSGCAVEFDLPAAPQA